MEKIQKKTTPLMVLLIVIASAVLFKVFPISQASTGQQVTTLTSEEKLEKTLRAMEGVGEVKVYFYYGQMQTESQDTNLFSQYFRSSAQTSNDVTGMLIVAEKAEDVFIKNEIRTVVSQVMQLPVHQIIIVQMEKQGGN